VKAGLFTVGICCVRSELRKMDGWGQQAGGHDVNVVKDGVQVTGLLDLRIIRGRVRGWIRRVEARVREQRDTEKKRGPNGGK
jgi:hypothetical protein